MLNRHGTGALVFTDIEDSSGLWERFGDRFMGVVSDHNDIIGDLCRKHDGAVIKEGGDAFFLFFDSAPEALGFALDVQEAIATHDWTEHGPLELRVRMGLHFGAAWQQGADLFGSEVNRAARICDAGHGGQVLASEPFLAACGDPPHEVVITDLARHRLRGLAEPEHLHQMTREHWPRQQWPVLRTLNAISTNLPAQVTSFVGRERELARIVDYLEDESTRICTLTGPGGSGKSRLGQQAAAQAMQHFPDGVFWVELADLTTPEAVAGAALQVLGLKPDAHHTAAEQIAEHMGGRTALIALDNFEHLMDAADFVADVSRRASTLQFLITSREVLRIPGEHICEVPPLSLPEPPINWRALSQYDSVHLFLHRARNAAGEFEITPDNAAAVAGICSRLDGIPLALELAAGWARVLTPHQMLDQLGPETRVMTSRVRGVSQRQRTLTGAIEWSYRLLDEEARRVFRMVSAFEGGFFLDSAEAVCGPGAAVMVIDLHDKSLLYSREFLGQQRFYVLETIREFAVERLREAGEAEEASRRHSEHILEMATELWRGFFEGQRPGQAHQRAAVEWQNMLSALATLSRGEWLPGSRYLVDMFRVSRAGDLRATTEALEVLRRLCDDHRRASGGEWPAALAYLLMPALFELGLNSEVLQRADEWYQLAEMAGAYQYGVAQMAVTSAIALGLPLVAREWMARADEWTAAPALVANAVRWSVLGEHEKAVELARRGLHAVEDLHAPARTFAALHPLMHVSMRAGRLEEAYAAAERVVALARDADAAAPHVVARVSAGAVPVFARSGHADKAEALARTLGGMASELSSPTEIGLFATLAMNCNQGRLWDLARHLSRDRLGSWPPQGAPQDQVNGIANYMAETYARTGSLEAATSAIETTLSQNWPWDTETYRTGQYLKAAGEVLRVAGRPGEAATVTELARRLQQDQPFLQLTCDELLELIAEDLSPEGFRRARKAADGMKPSEAVAFARVALGL